MKRTECSTAANMLGRSLQRAHKDEVDQVRHREADIGVAKALYYPDISLTALLAASAAASSEIPLTIAFGSRLYRCRSPVSGTRAIQILRRGIHECFSWL
jgi:hypothetical protein